MAEVDYFISYLENGKRVNVPITQAPWKQVATAMSRDESQKLLVIKKFWEAFQVVPTPKPAPKPTTRKRATKKK